jgi:hypothetical protein
VGSFELDGVTFRVYSGDHGSGDEEAPHVHCRYQGVEVIVELGVNRAVKLADRDDAIRP